MKQLLIKALPFLRILIGSVFIVSGFIKLMQPYQNFLSVVHSYEILKDPLADWFAIAMPWAEFILGVFLILGLWVRPAILSLWAMNTIFIIALASALIRRLPIQECGCFGESFSLPPQWMLALDVLMWCLFMMMAGYFESTRTFSLDKKFDNFNKIGGNSHAKSRSN